MIDYKLKAETASIRNLITNIYPVGIVSYVADSFDFFGVIDHCIPKLKDIIMSREGTFTIRPDSGDPEEILCGNAHGKTESERRGLIECLWDIFGGTINSKGYKQLDPHIGAIYGDSITMDRAYRICAHLKEKGFASTNVVFGVGSYSYQYVTRDTLGWAMKATYAEINGVGIPIFKDPITDDGTKKSHKGLLKVVKEGGAIICKQEVTWNEFNEPDNLLRPVFLNGELKRNETI